MLHKCKMCGGELTKWKAPQFGCSYKFYDLYLFHKNKIGKYINPKMRNFPTSTPSLSLRNDIDNKIYRITMYTQNRIYMHYNVKQYDRDDPKYYYCTKCFKIHSETAPIYNFRKLSLKKRT